MDAIRLVGSQRKAVENCAGSYLYGFFLAAYADICAGSGAPDAFEFTAEKGYDSFASLVELAPPGARARRPVTIMRGAKTLLAALFAALVSVVDDSGKLHAASVKSGLVNAAAKNSGPVRFMIYATEALWPKIAADGFLGRDLDSVGAFRAKLEALVANKAHIDPGADELARIFVRFLKCVAWGAANFAAEHKVTLNAWFLRSLFRSFGAFPDVGSAEALLEFLDAQCAWVANTDSVPKGGVAPAAPAALAEPAAPAALAAPAAPAVSAAASAELASAALAAPAASAAASAVPAVSAALAASAASATLSASAVSATLAAPAESASSAALAESASSAAPAESASSAALAESATLAASAVSATLAAPATPAELAAPAGPPAELAAPAGPPAEPAEPKPESSFDYDSLLESMS